MTMQYAKCVELELVDTATTVGMCAILVGLSLEGVFKGNLIPNSNAPRAAK